MRWLALPGRLRRAAPALSLLAVLAGATACGDGTVTIAYRPTEGDRYRYSIDVESETETDIEGQPLRTSDNAFTIAAVHRVVSNDDTGSEVAVELTVGRRAARELLVRLDRAAQLTEVVEIEGLPAAVLGDLGLSEIFPAAAAAPPAGRLRPGDTWAIDAPVQVTGSPRERLVGTGRLAELDVRDGRQVAVVISTYRLPVSRRGQSSEADRQIDGLQTTRSKTTYDLSDGSVLEAEAVTTGQFAVRLSPPGDQPGPTLSGRLEVTVRSSTERVD